MKKEPEPRSPLLASQNCIITGASRGLGARLALAFWEEGANLLLVGRSLTTLNLLSRTLPDRKNQRRFCLETDLGEPEAPPHVVRSARKVFRSLGILVNNAAVQGPIGPAWQVDWEDWKQALQVDLFAPIELCRLCIPWMVEGGFGRIINISGGGATAARPNFSAYATAKTALVRFSETLALEAQNAGVAINCVAPGAMNTTLLDTIIRAGPESAGEEEYQKAVLMQQHGGDSSSRAVALCLFLASQASSGISGKLISAPRDPWESLPERLEDLRSTPDYTLRRVSPGSRREDLD
jgi:NAD(P)-dependent dehydrogenase (short-subunit alcohol dehydrogenase family)